MREPLLSGLTPMLRNNVHFSRETMQTVVCWVQKSGTFASTFPRFPLKAEPSRNRKVFTIAHSFARLGPTLNHSKEVL